MPVETVALPAPLVLVPWFSLDEQLRRQTATHDGMPEDATQIIHDLNELEGGAPTLVIAGDDRYKPSLRVHTRGYRLLLELTNRHTGYIVKSIAPLRLADHAKLARSSLLVRPPTWRMVLDLKSVPDGANAQWQELEEAWQRLGQSYGGTPRTTAITEAQVTFLSTADRLIDAAEEITTREAQSTEPYPYQRIAATGGRRGSPRAHYEFELTGARAPQQGAFVRIQGGSETRGQVNRIAGRFLTVRFDQPVSWDLLPSRGALEVIPSTVVFDKQRQAVAAFRAQKTENTGLLAALVEHRVREITPDAAQPVEALDPEQLLAYRKALATEDLLVVIGPPGTGKTRTITEIARTAAQTAVEHGRVLVTSHTNRAVDNVLARLPRDLVVVRVGGDKVHEDVKPLLLEEQTENLSEGIRSAMGVRVQAYREAEEVAPWTVRLGEQIRRSERLAGEAESAADALRSSLERAAAPAGEQLAALRGEADRQRPERERLAEETAHLQARVEAAQERSHRRLTGWFHRFRAGRGEAGLAVLREGMSRLAALSADLERRSAESAAAMRRAMREDPASLTALAERAAADTRLRTAIAEGHAAAGRAVAALGRVVPDFGAPGPLPADPGEALAFLRGLHRNLEAWVPVLRERLNLAQQWRAAVDQDPGQLIPELIRYAQVVGATCIGAASRPELSGVEFDLGIIDEAGQIGVPDVLVPLARVRRGVLVGDDQQLPPFLDSDVAAWGQGEGDADLIRLMSLSALEQLRIGLPSSHVVQLTRQRRMPAEIADFVSEAFYRGSLITEKQHRHSDPLFARPMAFVDTGALAARVRGETSGGRVTERHGRPGVLNTCEADLLARLAAFYHRRGSEWVVIVPYLAQRFEVIHRLTPLIGDSQIAAASVGSVDAYQGGESDVVLYGFTRSNPAGRIGFLRELRRANVAFSRAKSQLVMTGDLGTLLRADDPGFRKLAERLDHHLRDCGDLRAYAEVQEALGGDASVSEGGDHRP